MILRSLIWHRVFQIRCWLVAFGLGIWTGGLALNGGSTVPGAPTLSGQDAVVQVVVDNDYALLAGNLSGPTRLVYQPGDDGWGGQYSSSLYASVKMSLTDGETHLYVVAMGGGGGESFQGKINGIDLTSLSVPQVETALYSDNGYLNIADWLYAFSPITVSGGGFSLTLADVQLALHGQSWGTPPSSLSGALTTITSLAWPFPSGNAVVFRFQASALNLVPLPSNQSVTLSWLAPSYDGGSQIVDYLVQYSTDVTDEKKWTTFDEGVSAATTAVVTGLINGTAYQFRVAAINAHGEGFDSVDSPSVRPIGPLDAITITGVEDEALTFQSSAFLYAFANGSGPALYGVRIKSLPTSGILKRSSTAVAIGDFILTSEIGTLTYTPAANESGAKAFRVDVSDGASFSAESEVTMNLASVNDAPVAGSASLTSILEDVAASDNLGTAVSVLADVGSDADTGALKGIAVTAVDSTHGVWQYSLDGGATWSSLTGVSESSACLLKVNDPNHRIRFLPQADYDGGATVTYRAWDQTTDASGQTSNGLLAWISFENSLDDSANGALHSGSWSSSSSSGFAADVPSGAGVGSYAGVFNGSSRVDLANSAALNVNTGVPFSMAAWIRTGFTDSAERVILAKALSGADSGNNTAALFVDYNGRLRFDNFFVNAVQSVTSVRTGNWVHVAVTYDGTTFRLYVDGQPDGAGAFSGSNENQVAWTFSVGQSLNTAFPGAGFQGNIDEVGFWNRTLIASEVLAIKNNGISSGVNLTSTGGSTAYSANTGTGTLIVTPVNDAPTLTTVSALTGGTEDTAFTISYATLAAAANEADVEGDSLSFQIEAVSSGTLMKGGVAVTAGTKLLPSETDSLVWTPASNANGTLNAFTVKAWDGQMASASAVQVSVEISAVNDAPTVIAPASLVMTEDNAGNLTFTGTPFADIDSSILTVTLSVSDGTITGNAGTGITVWGTAIARIFSGTVSDLNTYFTTAGNITYQGALNNTENRTLTTTVNDGADTTTPPVSGYTRWFDASTLNLANGASVSLWPDGSGSHYDAVKFTDRQEPKFVSDAGTGTGLGAVTFTAGVKNLDGKSTVLDEALGFTRDTAIRSVFSVFKGSSFLLTDNYRYDFHRPSNDKQNDPLWVLYSNENILNGVTYVNQVLVNGLTFTMPTAARNGFNLVSVLTTGPVSADSFNRDRTEFHSGTQSHAEVILYDRVLSNAERVLVENYLSAKWFGSGSGLRNSVTSTVSFIPLNDAPTITSIGAQTTLEDTSTGPIVFSLADSETLAGNLTVSATSSNPELVAVSGIRLGSSDLSLGSSQGLIGRWSFDSVDDLGKNAVTGAALVKSGNPVWSSNGKIGGAVEFNGSSLLSASTSTIENLPLGNSSYSVSLWFKARTLNYGGFIGWGVYGSQNKVNAFRLNGNASLHNYWWDNDLSASTGSAMAENVWYHAVVTYDGTIRSIYLNGQKIASGASSGADVQAGNFEIGRTQVSEYFDGWIDEVAIYNRALSDTEITQLAQGAGKDRTITLTPMPNASGTSTITLTVTDEANAKATTSFVLTVTPVNVSPTLTTVSALTGGTEDTALTISYSTLAAAANEADVDGDSLSFRIEAVSSGTLTKGGLVVTAGATLLSSGESLVWTPASNANGTLNAFTVKAWDGQLASASAVQVSVEISAVNDAPTVIAPASVAMTEDNAGNLTFTGTPFADIDSSILTVTLSVSDGTITGNEGTGITVWGTAIARIFSGTVSDLNTYFTTAGKITYQGALNNTENRTLTTTVSDGADTTVPPVSGYARWFDASTLNLANGASVVLWPDGSGSGYDAIKLSDRQAPKFVSDAGTGTGLGAVSFMTGVKPTGRSTDMDQALDFTRDTAIRSVFSVFKGSSFLLTDSGGDRYDFHRPSDDKPNDPLWVDLRANLSNPFITAGNTYVNQVLVNGSTFSMPTEARNGFNLVSVLTTGPVSADSFNRDRIFHSGIQSHAEVILYDRVLTDAERVLVENYLSAKWFGPGRRASVTSTVSFTPVSDTPVVVAGGSFNYTENAAAGVMSSTVTVSDVDSLQITGATVTISAGLTSGDVLGFTTQNGITGNYATSTGVLTLSGASTVENYQTALRSVTYWSTSENPAANSASRTVSWQVIDANSASSVSVTSTISITAVNDAPMLTSVDLLTGGIEDMDYTITYEALAAAGNESDLDNSSILFRIGTVSSGSLTKNGVAVTPGSTLLAAGESVVWRPAVNANGVLEAFIVTAWDGQSASSTAVPVQISVTAAPHGLGSELLVNPGFELRESSNSLYPLGWNSTVGFVVFTGSVGEYGPPAITTGGQLAFGYSSSVVVSQTAGLGALGITAVSEFQLEYRLARNQQAGIYWVQVEFLSASGQVLAQRRQPSSGTAAAPSTWTTETVRFNRGEIAEFDQITQVRVSLFGQQSPLIWAGHYGPFFDYVSLKPSLRTPLAVSGITALDKVYDATTSVELNTAGANLVGVVSGDSVNLSAVGAVGVFSSPTVGATKAVTVSGLTLSGNQAWKYSLVPPAGLTAAITAKALTVTGLSGVNKSYDRTTAATVSGSAALSGVISRDTVTLGGTPVFTFASANVGAGIVITTTGYTLSGDQALNYSLTQPTGLTGTITAKALSIGAPTIASKVYDGTTAAGVVTVGELSGLISPETLTVTGTAAAYGSAAVGTYSGVAVTYTLANGGSGNTAGLASNYSLAAGSASGTITPRDLVITVDPVSLMSDFDGQSHGVLWTTTPAGISVEVLYNGSTTLPKAAGSYSVTLSSADARFSARLAVTLVIRKTVQGITLSSAVVAAGLQTVSDSSGRYLLQATLGQPLAGPASAVSGMQLNSGFWFTEQFSAALDGRNLVGAKLESKIRASVILRGSSIDAPEATVMGPEISRLALGVPPSTRLTVLPVAGSGEVWIRVSGVPSGRWLIQYQDRLHSNEWLDEGLVELDGDGLGAVRAATGVGEMRFYRLVQQ